MAGAQAVAIKPRSGATSKVNSFSVIIALFNFWDLSRFDVVDVARLPDYQKRLQGNSGKFHYHNNPSRRSATRTAEKNQPANG